MKIKIKKLMILILQLKENQLICMKNIKKIYRKVQESKDLLRHVNFWQTCADLFG